MLNKIRLILPCMLFTMANCQKQTQVPAIIPLPLSIELTSGSFNLTAQTTIANNSDSSNFAADYLALQIEQYKGIKPLRVKSDATINLQLISDKALGSEGYTLNVDTRNIKICANTTAGLFYGVQTLVQLIAQAKPSGSSFEVSCVTIFDKPRFAWRGMHLDVSRHFMPKEFVKKYIDFLALHKMNHFHWHLTDDQGWRIEIKKYPRLTEVGAWRADRHTLPWTTKDEDLAKLPPTDSVYGGFYTQDEIREIVAYAAQRAITVVPEIEMPGHCMAVLASYPELSCKGGPFNVTPLANYSDNAYCAGNEATFTFIQDVLDEVMALFPSTYIHIGGDEVFYNGSAWSKCPKCLKRMKQENCKDIHELQAYFIKRVEKYLVSKGHRLIGWDEILDGGLAPEATVMSWRGMQGGIEAAKAHHNVIMTPTEFCYFDYPQNDVPSEQVNWGRLLTLEKVYAFEPVPADLKPAEATYILGAQANVWTELIPVPERAEYMVCPRMAALSEVLWSPAEKRDITDFRKRLQPFYALYDHMQVNYQIQPPQGFDAENIFADSVKVELTTPNIQTTIRYTLDGTEPGANSIEYKAPFYIKENCTLKARAFIPSGRGSIVRVGSYTRTNWKEAVNVTTNKEGLSLNYYEGRIRKPSDLDLLKPLKTEVVNNIDIPAYCRNEFFGLQYNGYLYVEADSVYTFRLFTNDGGCLLLDNDTIVQNRAFGMKESIGQALLRKGSHTFCLIYFQYRNEKEFQFEAFPSRKIRFYQKQ